MSRVIKVGIIGFGYMGHFHFEEIKRHSELEVAAIYDIDLAKLEEARSIGLSAYDDIDSFLAAGIELVIIATPNDSHYKYALLALESGVNVLCEKPAMMSVAELNQVLRVAEEHDLFFTSHHNRRFDPDYLVVKDVISQGFIGGVTTIESSCIGQRGVCFGWRADPEKGGGMLYDWGIHLIDQALMLYPNNTVTSVYACLRSILTPLVDDYLELNITMDNEVCFHILVSTFALQPKPRWYVFGDKGTLKLDDFSGIAGGIARIKDNVHGFKRVSNDDEHLGPSRTMAHLEPENLEVLDLPTARTTDYNLFYEDITRCIKSHDKPLVKPEEITRDLKVIEAAFMSSKERRVLDLSI